MSLSTFASLCSIFQFSSIFWDLLTRGISITLKVSRVPWGPFTDCPKIVSVSKHFRSQKLPVAYTRPFNPRPDEGRVRASSKEISLDGHF